MKKLSFLAVAALVMMGVAFASCDSGKSVSLKKDIDSVSYLIGANYGQGLRESIKDFPGGMSGNLDALISGFLNAAKGDSIHLGMEMNEIQAYMNNFFQNAQMKEMEAVREEEDKFLSENGKLSGVITTESGLQYKVITAGTGPKPTEADIVKIHYHGTFLDGEIFESSIDRGEPIVHPVSQFIPGWTEGLQLMTVGSKCMFWIRHELGYGPPGSGHPMAGKFLVFEVELLDIVKE